MKAKTKTSAKTSTKSKRRDDFGSGEYSSQRAKGSSDTYQKFTDLIIEKLEQGMLPWRQPWHEMGLPSNYMTKKPYKGINLWLLLSCNHQYPYYLTFKQAQKRGCKIKKGAKSIPIYYWNFAFRDKKTGKVIPDERIGLYDLNQGLQARFL